MNYQKIYSIIRELKSKRSRDFFSTLGRDGHGPWIEDDEVFCRLNDLDRKVFLREERETKRNSI